MSLMDEINRKALSGKIGGKLGRKLANKAARKRVDAVNAKYTEAFAPDAVADVERASRTESRRSQREVKTGRSSTILSMRDDMGMDAIARPNTMNVAKMEGKSNEDKLKSLQKDALGDIKKDYVSQLDSIGKSAYIRHLDSLGLDAAPEKKLDAAKRKKKALAQDELSSRFNGGGLTRFSRIGGL
jgi:hypothetical protein